MRTVLRLMAGAALAAIARPAVAQAQVDPASQAAADATADASSLAPDVTGKDATAGVQRSDIVVLGFGHSRQVQLVTAKDRSFTACSRDAARR